MTLEEFRTSLANYCDSLRQRAFVWTLTNDELLLYKEDIFKELSVPDDPEEMDWNVETNVSGVLGILRRTSEAIVSNANFVDGSEEDLRYWCGETSNRDPQFLESIAENINLFLAVGLTGTLEEKPANKLEKAFGEAGFYVFQRGFHLARAILSGEKKTDLPKEMTLSALESYLYWFGLDYINYWEKVNNLNVESP